MSARLHTVAVSPACAAAEAALRLRGVAYEPVVRPPGLGRRAVPALDLDGVRVAGVRAILEHVGLAPGDGAAAALAEEELEPAAARIAWATIRRDPRTMRGYLGGGTRWVPRAAMVLAGASAAGADEMTVRDDVHALPEQLDRVDAWVHDGVLDAEQPAAAELRIGAALRLLLTLGDLRPLIDARPCAALARLLPEPTGRVPSRVMPDNWLPMALATS